MRHRNFNSDGFYNTASKSKVMTSNEQCFDKAVCDILQELKESSNCQNDVTECTSNVDNLFNVFPNFSKIKFLSDFQIMFRHVIDCLIANDSDQLSKYLDDQLCKHYYSLIEKKKEKNLKQEINVVYKDVQIVDAKYLDTKVIVEIKMVVDQMSSVMNEKGESYDNPNKIVLPVKYKIKLTSDKTEEKWLFSEISVISDKK